MRTAKAALALLVSFATALPASAQVRVAASMAGSAVPRVVLSAPLTLASAPSAAPFLNIPAAPAFAPSAFAAASVPSAAAAALVLPVAAAAPMAQASPSAVAAARGILPALPAPSARAPGEASSPAAALAARGRWERFWSGSAARGASGSEAEAVDAAFPATPPAAPLARPVSRSASRPASRAAAAAAILAPAAHGVSALVAHAAPFLEAGAVVVGAYFLNRGVHALLNRIAAKKGLDQHRLAVVRLAASVALWTGAAAAALVVGGAPHATIAAAFGAGGTIATLGMRDVLGNAIQGLNFLLTRPFTIGARVQIADQTGTVSDVTLTTLTIAKDDGSEVKVRHAALAAMSVIVFGDYVPDAKLSLGVPAKPAFKGAAGAVWGALDRRFWLSSAAFAGLLAVPHFVPFLAAGAAGTAVHYALAAATAWLTQRVASALGAATDLVARENSWRTETRAVAKLAVTTALWALGGGAALRLLGVSWTALGASLGITTLGIGLASNNFFGSVVTGGEVLLSKPFKVGDRLQVGALTGVVEDMTLYNVVLKLDEGRHALVPYAVVRDAALVVTPEKTEK